MRRATGSSTTGENHEQLSSQLLSVILVVGTAAAQAPAPVTPPAGNQAAFTFAATGDLTYECRAVADKPGTFAWTFAGPNAKLWDASKKEAGRYYAGPTWEAADGSKVTGTQLAVAPGAAGAIPLQLVQATTVTGERHDGRRHLRAAA